MGLTKPELVEWVVKLLDYAWETYNSPYDFEDGDAWDICTRLEACLSIKRETCKRCEESYPALLGHDCEEAE